MKKRVILSALAILTMAGLGFSNTVSFKLDYFMPSAKSDFWTTEFNQMSFTRSSFQNTSFGFSYEVFLTRELSLVLGLDTFSKNKGGYYRGYVAYQFSTGDYAFPDTFQGDYTPGHSIGVTITPIQISLKLAPLGRRMKVIPYIGAGGGIYLWSLRMVGDMIDFSTHDVFTDTEGNDIIGYPIYSIDAWEGGNGLGRIAFGFHAFGGVMVPVANRMTVDAEFKYNNARGTSSDDPYSGIKGFKPFDLGGYQIALGITYWF
jgi:opacity protein-like surface antigen